MAKMSPVTLFIRVFLILVLVALVGGLFVEFSARSAATKAFEKLDAIVGQRNTGPDSKPTTPDMVAEMFGKKPDSVDNSIGNFKRESFSWRGFIRDYHVEVTYVVLDKLEKVEESRMNVVSKFGF
jgi:hypothetical protein